jgi:hypothetical protein
MSFLLSDGPFKLAHGQKKKLKYGDFHIVFLRNMATLGFCFPKESFCRTCTVLVFLSPSDRALYSLRAFQWYQECSGRDLLDITKQNKQTTLIDRCPTQLPW